MRTGMNDRANMFATQGGGKPSRHKPIHNLHALDVAGRRHDLEESPIDRQRALELCQIGDARLAKQFCLLSIGAIGVRTIHTIDVLHDREAGRAQRVGEQKRAGISPVLWNTRARKLVMVIRRKGASPPPRGPR